MRKVITIIAVILFFTCSYAHDTRPYVPKPDGAKGVVFYYKNIGGNTLYSDGKKVTDDFDVSGNLLIIRLYTILIYLEKQLHCRLLFLWEKRV